MYIFVYTVPFFVNVIMHDLSFSNGYTVVLFLYLMSLVYGDVYTSSM